MSRPFSPRRRATPSHINRRKEDGREKEKKKEEQRDERKSRPESIVQLQEVPPTRLIISHRLVHRRAHPNRLTRTPSQGILKDGSNQATAIRRTRARTDSHMSEPFASSHK